MHRLFIFLLIIFSTVAHAQATQEMTLDNGMKIIVKEDHRAPVAVMMTVYRIGSADEPGGITGISHVLEHMMFKGTPKYPAGAYSKIIADNGGQQNAMTGPDFTIYFAKLAADRLAISFKLEADRMQHLNLTEEDFAKEIKVVMEERRMRTEDKPSAYTRERFIAAAHLSAPYHHPIVGWMNDLENMTHADAKNWYNRWYSPNNAALVVVGDVEPKQIFSLAQRYFGQITARKLPVRKPQRAPGNPGQRQVTVERTAQLPILYMGFNTPSRITIDNSKEAYALGVLSAVMSGGDSSRFARELVRQQRIAVSADSDYDMYSRFDGLFTINGIPAGKTTLTDLQNAFTQQIKRLQTELVSEKELTRIKRQVIADRVYQEDSIFGQAIQLAIFENTGIGWREMDEYSRAIQAVTAEQVRAVAQKYLVPNRMTVATLIPQAKAQAQGGK